MIHIPENANGPSVVLFNRLFYIVKEKLWFVFVSSMTVYARCLGIYTSLFVRHCTSMSLYVFTRLVLDRVNACRCLVPTTRPTQQLCSIWSNCFRPSQSLRKILFMAPTWCPTSCPQDHFPPISFAIESATVSPCSISSPSSSAS